MSVQTDIKLIDNASKVLASINEKVDKLSDKIDDINSTSIKPKGMPETESAFQKLAGGGKSLLGTFSQISTAIYGVKEIVGTISSVVLTMTKYSDTLSETMARLNLMNDGLISTEQLWNQIYESSMRSRGSIVDTADAVAKLGLNTNGLFKSNTELVKFSEILNKSFKITGTSADNIKNAMIQITQGLSSGLFQGEELNALADYAPMLLQEIADYMKVPRGELKKLGAEGKITADIVKNAILGATDDINAKFDELPMKFSELGTQFENIWYNNMQMVSGDLEGIPQKLADNLLPIWDAFTYAIFADLDGVYKAQQKGINDTTSAYANFAQQVSAYTGYVISENEAMKIQFVASFEMTETLFKKTGNVVWQITKSIIGGIVYLVEGAIVFILKLLEELSFGLFNFSNEIKTHSGNMQYLSNKIFSYENVTNDKYFGLTGSELSETITEQATSTVIKDKMKSNPNSLMNSYLFTGNKNTTSTKAGFYPQNLGSLENPKFATSTIQIPKLPTSPSASLGNIDRNVSDISKNVSNLNDVNKAIMEINEATYHNNVANQFNGNIQIVGYGAGEEEQKAIGKATEDAIRKVFLNDYANTQAMGVYA